MTMLAPNAFGIATPGGSWFSAILDRISTMGGGVEEGEPDGRIRVVVDHAVIEEKPGAGAGSKSLHALARDIFTVPPVGAIDPGKSNVRAADPGHLVFLGFSSTDRGDITTTRVSNGCNRLKQALDRLESVASLAHGWDSEGGPPPNSQLVGAAANLLQYLQRDDLPLAFVCPIAGGGLQLEWSSGGKEVELELIDERTIGFLRAEAAPSGRIIESGEYPISDINKSRELLDWLAEA